MQSQFNMRNPAVKRLMKEAQELKDATEQFHAQPLEDNIFEWHFTIRGPMESDFNDGIYHGRIVLPPEYPMKPPSIILLTPNGRFELNTKICLSISGHHPESWRPSWSIRTALLAIIGFMPTHGGGALGSLNYTTEERKILAKKSQDWKCTQCGHIKYLLKPVTEASKETDKEAKELASQISFKGENKTKKENEKKLIEPTTTTRADSTSTNSTTAAAAAAVTPATVPATSAANQNMPQFPPMFNPQMMPYMFAPPAGGMVYPPPPALMFPPMTDMNRHRLPWPVFPPMMPYGFPNPFMMPPAGSLPPGATGFPGFPPQFATPESPSEPQTQSAPEPTSTVTPVETQPHPASGVTPVETQSQPASGVTPVETQLQPTSSLTPVEMQQEPVSDVTNENTTSSASVQSEQDGLHRRNVAAAAPADDVLIVGIDWYSFVILILCSLGIAVLMLRRLQVIDFNELTDWLFHPPPR
ncbi:uncharacterized protein LOC141906682 isoform X2 [Tubulanus polymorphus]|uniref:uncharacterized protein LOC141906682 isoform X2 n=1 Tax=Tubulanus polymorphus TaxID=672921 RepID=UPI003DA20137